MDKVELAKLIGLYKTGYAKVISKYDILNLVEDKWITISETFCGGIEVEVEQDDLLNGVLSVWVNYLKNDESVEMSCIKQVEDLLWERAADEYLKRVHNAAMLVGG